MTARTEHRRQRAPKINQKAAAALVQFLCKDQEPNYGDKEPQRLYAAMHAAALADEPHPFAPSAQSAPRMLMARARVN